MCYGSRVGLALCAFVAGCARPTDPNVATLLSFVLQPASAESMSPIGTVSVAFRNADGGVVEGVATPVTLSLVGPSGAKIIGTATSAPVSGVSEFAGLTIDKAGSYALKASAEGFDDVLSNSFTIAKGPPIRLVIDSVKDFPAGITLIVTARFADAGGNEIPQQTGTITLAMAPGDTAVLVGQPTSIYAPGSGGTTFYLTMHNAAYHQVWRRVPDFKAEPATPSGSRPAQ